MRSGKDEGFVSFPGSILIIIFTSFSKCIEIYLVIIVIYFTFLTYGNELDNLLGKGSFNDFSQWSI